jgi:hypothetical protein
MEVHQSSTLSKPVQAEGSKSGIWSQSRIILRPLWATPGGKTGPANRRRNRRSKQGGGADACHPLDAAGRRSWARRSTLMHGASATPWLVARKRDSAVFHLPLVGLWAAAVCFPLLRQLPLDGERTKENNYVPVQFFNSTSEDLVPARARCFIGQNV